MRKLFLLLAALLAVAPISVAQNHPYVDLGLPSGTLWATYNIGASSPEEYGDYYAWGETETKFAYSWSNYKYANGDRTKLTKYCNKSNYGNNGYTDSRTVLEKSDDVAYQKWGSGWCMPTQKQFQELYDNCTTEWTTKNGKYGRLFTSKLNDKTLFFPAAGWKDGDGILLYVGRIGYYRSSSLGTGVPVDSRYLAFSYRDVIPDFSDYRSEGLSVRPVRCKN